MRLEDRGLTRSSSILFREITRKNHTNKARMAPYVTSTMTGVLFEGDTIEENVAMETPKEKYERRVIWKAVASLMYLHLAALYGVYLMFTSANLMTTAFALILHILCCWGVTAGAHRLWSHRAFKAKWPLQVLLMIFNTTAFQYSVIHWARNHRVHHKYTETNADPHNAKRGFFFSHVGWLMSRKHPDVMEKGKGVDMSDLEKNPVLAFQRRYYVALVLLLCFFIPTAVPVLCWNETWSNAFFVSTILRQVFGLNAAWLVNSAAHLYGNKPYDKFINPTQNKIANLFTFGEGWHNYHHVFPWDYKAAELGNYRFNGTTAFIDFFAKIGWAYDLKMAPTDMVQKIVKRAGDGSHEVWGCGDADQAKEERDQTVLMHRLRKD
ncbi:acyl-CoA Delta-9 desaturase-like isoform X1 [Andrena cerasifolii]|uniref:acyl-CoA Delta-9 desaturase-like isoform X1 n=1 Tax=Andrena cerasifolii TaxID=2819439 RepID=UPI00403801D1